MLPHQRQDFACDIGVNSQLIHGKPLLPHRIATSSLPSLALQLLNLLGFSHDKPLHRVYRHDGGAHFAQWVLTASADKVPRRRIVDAAASRQRRGAAAT